MAVWRTFVRCPIGASHRFPLFCSRLCVGEHFFSRNGARSPLLNKMPSLADRCTSKFFISWQIIMLLNRSIVGRTKFINLLEYCTRRGRLFQTILVLCKRNGGAFLLDDITFFCANKCCLLPSLLDVSNSRSLLCPKSLMRCDVFNALPPSRSGQNTNRS